ncbi:MAG: hypothetical protein KF760_25245 [Candidatus Eremiobacteraeota bacterium]|nr:hypothetical protein [Candidatus Eremiobacteraeota bacterium]MCW5872164.1 hypothetical protein [Candidatus Eremiobacteraeota bacterium]
MSTQNTIRKREQGLLCQPVGAELIIYDSHTQECHHFSEEVTYLWNQVEQETTIPSLIESFLKVYPEHSEQGTEFVQAAVADLTAKGLLTGTPQLRLADEVRRQFLKSSGLLLVGTMVAPLPSAAASTQLSIVSARYFNNQIDSPNTVPRCGNAGTNAPCMGADIATTLSSRIAGGTFSPIACSNGNFGDPCSGILKECKVIYRCRGVDTTIRICEGQMITIPACT